MSSETSQASEKVQQAKVNICRRNAQASAAQKAARELTSGSRGRSSQLFASCSSRMLAGRQSSQRQCQSDSRRRISVRRRHCFGTSRATRTIRLAGHPKRTDLISAAGLLLLALLVLETHGQQPTNWRLLPLGAFESPAPQQQHDQVPYKTFYVSQACEWKSNLFVPKSNDILFAQSATAQPQLSARLNQEPARSAEQLVGDGGGGGGNADWPPASVMLVGGDSPPWSSSAQQQQQQQQPQPLQLLAASASAFGRRARRQSPAVHGNQQTASSGGGDDANVILSTSSKALVLALRPRAAHLSGGNTAEFAGFEQACSIRLLVPRNMRILAKLSARKLTFTDEQQVLVSSAGELTRALWLNASQSEFSETEHRTLETEGNVLAFRFLLERFALSQAPEMSFQVVLTAFQTLGECLRSKLSRFYWPIDEKANRRERRRKNSKLSTNRGGDSPITTTNRAGENEGLSLSSGGGGSSGANPFAPPPLQPTAAAGENLNQRDAQFICDSQRLISANLVCDGYKNCQDGHDEEPASCLAPIGTGTISSTTEQHAHKSKGPSTQQVLQQTEQPARSLVWRLLGRVADSSLVGFLLGLLLLLLLLVSLLCCLYCCLVLWRRHLSPRLVSTLDKRRPATGADSAGGAQRRRRRLDAKQIGAPSSSHHLLAPAVERQNADNAARLRAIERATESGAGSPLSILKKAPLARFETVPGQPVAQVQPELARPAPPPRRGALASSLTSATGRQRFVAPTPAQRRPRPQENIHQQFHYQPPPTQQQQLSFTSRATRVEQSSSSRRRADGASEERVTSYVYSEDTARYSESYLLGRGSSSAASQARDYANLGQPVPPPPQTSQVDKQQQSQTPQSPTHRQSSLI